MKAILVDEKVPVANQLTNVKDKIDGKIIYVYDDFSEDNPILIGKMYVGVIKGGETYSFEYSSIAVYW